MAVITAEPLGYTFTVVLIVALRMDKRIVDCRLPAANFVAPALHMPSGFVFRRAPAAIAVFCVVDVLVTSPECLLAAKLRLV